jgi:hypothetical protein
MCRYTHVESDKNGFSILRFSVFFQRFGPNKEYKNVKIIVIVESHGPKLLRGDLSGFGNGFFLGGGLLLEGPKIGWSPRTQESRASARMLRREGTQNPRKPVLASKVVNPFTRALVPLL